MRWSQRCRRTTGDSAASKIREYFDYLDRQESLVGRLCDSGTKTTLAFGDHDDVGLTDAERRGLEECPSVTMVEIAGAGHMTLNDKPARVAELILEASRKPLEATTGIEPV